MFIDLSWKVHLTWSMRRETKSHYWFYTSNIICKQWSANHQSYYSHPNEFTLAVSSLKNSCMNGTEPTFTVKQAYPKPILYEKMRRSSRPPVILCTKIRLKFKKRKLLKTVFLIKSVSNLEQTILIMKKSCGYSRITEGTKKGPRHFDSCRGGLVDCLARRLSLVC